MSLNEFCNKIREYIVLDIISMFKISDLRLNSNSPVTLKGYKSCECFIITIIMFPNSLLVFF